VHVAFSHSTSHLMISYHPIKLNYVSFIFLLANQDGPWLI